MQRKTIGYVKDRQVFYDFPQNVCCGCGQAATETISVPGSSVEFSLPICAKCIQEEAQRESVYKRIKTIEGIGIVLLVIFVLGAPIFLTMILQPIVSSWWMWLLLVNIGLVILVWLVGKIDDGDRLFNLVGILFAPRWSSGHPKWPVRKPIVSAFLGYRDLDIYCQDIYAEILDRTQPNK